MNEAMSGRRRAYDHRLRELACEEAVAVAIVLIAGRQLLDRNDRWPRQTQSVRVVELDPIS
jgi:hypothetical protein